jgi:Flp pilus assembly protein TadG
MKRSLRNKASREQSIPYIEAETERYVDLAQYEAMMSAVGRRARNRDMARKRVEQSHSKGQAMLVIALMMTVLIMFVGLGVDVGNLMGKRAKLQSAVDAAALSAAQIMQDGGVVSSTVSTKAYQMLQANGVPTSTLSSSNVNVDFASSQVTIHAVQAEDTFFMRIIPLWRTVNVSADATADFNSYAEINTKPYGQAGVVNELNISVWGIDSWRGGGDAYSPWYNPAVSANTINDEHAKMPYGYLYRIDVPADFPDTHLSVQIFDPDTYNRADLPPTPNTPIPTATFCPFPCAVQTATPYATPTLYGDAGEFTYCASVTTNCTSGDRRSNTGLKLGSFPLTAVPKPTAWPSRRVAFWRVDEFRRSRMEAGIDPGGSWNDSWATQTNFTLWHFNPHITSAFADPATLSDQSGGAYVAQYSVGADARTDRSWYQPPGFDITLSDPSNPACTFPNNECYERESNGNFYFYIYVQSISNGGIVGYQGSSENNFDIRVGPKQPNVAAGYACDTIGSLGSSVCMANNQYFAQAVGTPLPDWDDGTMEGAGRGASVLAKRSLPLNLDTGANFSMLFTQVSKNAAGQSLAIRHFDQDCIGGCGPSHTMQYQMQLCQVDAGGNYSPCADVTSDSCFGNVGTGYVGPDNTWYCPGCPAPEKVSIPVEGSSNYTSFFGPQGQCSTSWLRLQSDPSGSQDTTVWEMPFSRPRLIK